MDVVEYIIQSIFIIILFGFMLAGLVYSIMVFKSDKYLQVKEMDKQVRIARIDAKAEYKMAVLDYKQSRQRDKGNQ